MVLKKYIIGGIFVLSPFFCFAQSKLSDIVKRNTLTGALAFTAGAADGVREIITHKYYKFQKKHPKANHRNWNPKLSWRNKWDSGDPSNGEKFLFSSSLLVFTTDAYHALKLYDNLAMSFAGAIPTTNGKLDLKQKISDFFVIFIIRSVGFQITYSLMYDG